jgi:AcrR family transcriptional regulator
LPVEPPKTKRRANATRESLMFAAEALIAKQGIENTSIRDIVQAAGQRNESALHYHFKTRAGLIEALHETRSLEIQEARAQAMQQLLERQPEPGLRELCALMVEPPFRLLQTNPGIRRYIRAFGHTLALTNRSALAQVTLRGGGGASGEQLGKRLKSRLSHLDRAAYRRRMESAVRLCAVSMAHLASQDKTPDSAPNEAFISDLIDALQGLLAAPESAATQALSARTANAETKP